MRWRRSARRRARRGYRCVSCVRIRLRPAVLTYGAWSAAIALCYVVNVLRDAKLYLSGNDLSGPIPAELGRLATPASLDLRGNRLSGPIPPELSENAKLVV